MLNLKPGQRLNVQHIKSENSVPGTLKEINEKKLTLLLHRAINLERGDKLELEVSLSEDALYVLPGSYLETFAGDTCTIEVQGQLSRRQRRKAVRIPANLKTRCTLLSERNREQTSSQGEILNISSEGALVAVDRPLKIDSELMLTFEVPMGIIKDITTSIISKVVRAHENPACGKNIYGVEFQRSFNYACD